MASLLVSLPWHPSTIPPLKPMFVFPAMDARSSVCYLSAEHTTELLQSKRGHAKVTRYRGYEVSTCTFHILTTKQQVPGTPPNKLMWFFSKTLRITCCGSCRITWTENKYLAYPFDIFIRHTRGRHTRVDLNGTILRYVF
ncbi:hypothetical protein L798_01090 [Zootermopsis nevadensis]|uniref:Uncharacterized protein n=1 Tax=Zootermopsis nevadensis TaxID=136037 RepID=A0A067RER0_ZOONE|nr:hypothetical protein L798_01090 [Zootermopsis nevadensis]